MPSLIARFGLALIFSFLTLPARAAVDWKPLLPGLQQASWTGKDAQGKSFSLALFKIDPKQYQLRLVQASDYQLSKISAKEMLAKTGALLAVNGGFFDAQYKSLGLLVRDGKLLNPLRPISWWGVFSYDKADGARLEKPGAFRLKPSTELAIQAGPRLVDDNHIMPLKKNDSQKTFVGVTPDKQVVLGVTDLSMVDAKDLAQALKKELQIREALNLDGGGSTQLYAKVGRFEKEVSGVTRVTNGLVVLPRK